MPDQQCPPSKNAYVTLLTRPSYLAGALLFAYTLTTHSPTTPLIITYTPSTLPAPSIAALQREAAHSNIILHPVEHLRLPESQTAHGMVAERFIDTWTKLRVFDLWELEVENGGRFERLCWLDADMMIFSDPSSLVFGEGQDAFLKGGDGNRVMAVHTCVCNLDRDSWAPEEWNQKNCGMSRLTSSDQVAEVGEEGECYTLRNFNSGTFCWRPSKQIAQFVKDKFEQLGPDALRAMKFPDQDFLNEAFEGRWAALSWKTNALKTWQYWHTNFWVDNEVAVLHYIVDKPWAARVDEQGKAGYLGKDGETHKWWWAQFARWREERKGQGEHELLETMGLYVAGEGSEVSEEMRAIGGGAQDFAKKWEDKGEKEGE
ncbi:Glycosyltransferase family 8 protein [Pyrenophora tritici-repentis]|nr:Glycosyltransferase family 8 protein [Pyrenophora tritici-repentis]